jgi:hypothetical protein
VRGPPAAIDEDDLHDIRRLGASDDDLAALAERTAARDRTGVPVWPENWPVVLAFCAVATQWRTVWVGGLEGGGLMRTGLDYEGVRAGLAMLGIEVTPDLVRGLQVMEHAALEAWSER